MPITQAVPEYEIIAPHEAILSWKHNKVTQQVASILDQEIVSSGERIGRGETLGENVAQDTARAVGYTEGLQFAADLLKLQWVVETSEDTKDGKEGSKTE